MNILEMVEQVTKKTLEIVFSSGRLKDAHDHFSFSQLSVFKEVMLTMQRILLQDKLSQEERKFLSQIKIDDLPFNSEDLIIGLAHSTIDQYAKEIRALKEEQNDPPPMIELSKMLLGICYLVTYQFFKEKIIIAEKRYFPQIPLRQVYHQLTNQVVKEYLNLTQQTIPNGMNLAKLEQKVINECSENGILLTLEREEISQKEDYLFSCQEFIQKIIPALVEMKDKLPPEQMITNIYRMVLISLEINLPTSPRLPALEAKQIIEDICRAVWQALTKKYQLDQKETDFQHYFQQSLINTLNLSGINRLEESIRLTERQKKRLDIITDKIIELTNQGETKDTFEEAIFAHLPEYISHIYDFLFEFRNQGLTNAITQELTEHLAELTDKLLNERKRDNHRSNTFLSLEIAHA